jgi:hypothetical protein
MGAAIKPIIVKKKTARAAAIVNRKRSQGATAHVRIVHRLQIDIRDDVCIVQKKRGITPETVSRPEQPPAGLERLILFVGYAHVDTEISARMHEIGDLAGKMMGVDDETCCPGVDEPACSALEHCDAAHIDEGLWRALGNRTQPGAEPGGQDHCIHAVVV